MRTLLKDPFMTAYRVSLVAGVVFIAFLLVAPALAFVPGVIWIAAQLVMLREFVRVKRLDPRAHLDRQTRRIR
ncbi:MAG: hypothetical protein H6841_06125 [Planctomycetes bacterium]|nr:hypothetical protein [Planctomycetota bacterium]